MLFRWEVLLNLLYEHEIDAIKDLKMSGEQSPEQVHWPLLHLRLLDVVHGASEGVIHAIPRILPIHIVLVDQEAEHFKDPDGGMCLVQMNRIFLFEFSELGREAVLLLEAAEDILKGCRDIEV